jgi:hypothetical protein
MPFIRGRLNPRRWSAPLAGIACGPGIVGQAGAAERLPLVEPRVELIPFGDQEALGIVLTRILDYPVVDPIGLQHL